MTEPRSNDEDRAEIERLRVDCARWKSEALRHAHNYEGAWAAEQEQRARADKAEAERDDAYARGFEQVRRRCEAAEAALAAERAKVAAVEAAMHLADDQPINPPGRDDLPTDWQDGWDAAIDECRRRIDDALAAVGGSTEGDSDR